MELKHDGPLPISIGKNVEETSWKNGTMKWSDLLTRLSKSSMTQETHNEYMAMSKSDQDRIKDNGGFVGGHLKSGRRKKNNVACRQLVTLDADYAPVGFQDDLQYGLSCAYAVYSTHKHCPEKPRLRILIPLDRQVTPDEYEAIARKVAEGLGIDYFDATTYQPSRLMFWPSYSRDVEPVFDYVDAPWLKADEVLGQYPDWTDTSYWPVSSREKKKVNSDKDKQGNPLEKPGWIGAFNRTYSIREAIEKFIPDEYIPCDQPDRYTYAYGSTSAGLVIYDDVFAYSHHSTDPASNMLCSAFDLVRIHKFGNLDENQKESTPVDKLKSQKAMLEFVGNDEAVRKLSIKEHLSEFEEASGQTPEAGEDDSWITKLKRDKQSGITNALTNAVLIMHHDPGLSGLAFNELYGNIEILPEKGGVWWETKQKRFWTDTDDSRLEVYIAQKYTEFPKNRILTAIDDLAASRKYHPIREYLKGLPEWDGTKRVDTLLIDYLGAEDSSYIRAVTRKTLCAAVRRVFHPGCKFDTVLVICGEQGIGKSTIFHKLAKDWFSDSLNLRDVHDKTAPEKLQGNWIIEIGEMAGLGDAKVQTLRQFITTQDDKYREAYGRRSQSHPRQCIMVGTTNKEDGYLNDVEGGRRFWPVNTPGGTEKKPWDLTDEDIDQIWAEAMTYEKQGEALILTGEDAETAKRMQREAMVHDPRIDMVAEYLDILLPEDWYSRTLEERMDYMELSKSPLSPKGVMLRMRVSPQEIWTECFKQQLSRMTPKDIASIRGIMATIPGWNYRKAWLPRDKAFESKQVRGFVREESPKEEDDENW